MTQNKELERAKRLIRAMSEKTIDRGATEAEMQQAMQRIGDLLEQFNLTMDEVTLTQEKCVTASYNTGSKHMGVATMAWSALAAFTSCRVWSSRDAKGISLKFFGLESDTQMALYLCELIETAYDTEFQKFKLSDIYVNYQYGHRRPLQNNFQKGFAERVSARLRELINDRKRREKENAEYHREAMKERMVGASESALAEAARQTTGTSLMSLAKDKYVEEEFKKIGMKLRTTKRYDKSQYNGDARRAGSAAGDRVNFNRPVSGGTNNVAGYLK